LDIEAAFNQLQKNVNAPDEMAAEARERRNVFIDAFETLDDVDRGRPSGSLARGSQIDPIKDVDMYIEFDAEAHPDWGQPGRSAADALDYTREKVNELLGVNNGTFDKRVRLARWRNHAVKCFLDDPDDPDAFTVDAMPVLLQEDDSLLIPEALNSRWILANPKHLIEEVAARHSDWSYFVPCVRLLKHWTREHSTGIKPLVLEVMALDHLRAADTRGEALARFFAAAASAIDYPVVDPAGLCGEIQPGLDRTDARKHLAQAAQIAHRARDAQARSQTEEAGCLWRQIFGAAFPEPEGGCSKYLNIGTGIGIVGVTSRPRPRPIRDTPQG
jgi:Second Messenger Oligonucleotide or Dinucleotide Synthetase domain